MRGPDGQASGRDLKPPITANFGEAPPNVGWGSILSSPRTAPRKGLADTALKDLPIPAT